MNRSGRHKGATLRKHVAILPLQLLHPIGLQVNRATRRHRTRDDVEAAAIPGIYERHRNARHRLVVRLILAALGLVDLEIISFPLLFYLLSKVTAARGNRATVRFAKCHPEGFVDSSLRVCRE